jgi:integrase
MKKIKNLYHMRDSKYWWYRWSRGGKRYAVSLRTESLDEAIQAIERIRAGEWVREQQDKLDTFPTDISKMVENYIRRAQDRVKHPMRPGTAERRLRALNQILGDMKVTSAPDLSRKRIEGYLAGVRKAGRSADTAHTYGWYLRAFVRDLISQKLAPDDLDKFDIPERAATGRKNWLKLEVANRVIAAAEDQDLRFILFCGFHAGLRKSEILAAKVNWFDLDGSLLHVQNDPGLGFVLKDRENRSVPLTPEFCNFLRVYLKDRKGDEYCLEPTKSEPGYLGQRFEFRKRVFGHFDRCGVKCSLHDMRRSFASNLVSRGVSVYKVARWLGDGVAIVERSYGHLAPADRDIDVLGSTPGQKSPQYTSEGIAR